jgi:hypothetical protein
VIAAAAGARRTDSAYARFLLAYRASDVAYFDDTEGSPHAPPARLLRRLPQVAEVVPVQFVKYALGDNAVVAAIDDRPGRTIDRFKILSGRMANPRRPDEAVVSVALAETRHLHVGSTFPLVSRRELAQGAREGFRITFPNMVFHVVGIEVAPGEFPPQPPGLWPLIHLTPAFYCEYAGTRLLKPKWPSQLVRLKRGAKDAPAFVSEVERLAAGRPVFAQTQAAQGEPARRSFHLQAIALWVLAALAGLTAALVFGQLIARQAFLDATEAATLHAIGMTRRQLFWLGMLRAGAIAAFAAAPAVLIGFLLSPLTPLGQARIAEPSPGFRADALGLALGGLATALLVVGLAAAPVWRTARVTASERGAAGPAAGPRRSTLAAASSRIGVPPAVGAGIRFALERGRGRTAVPVRTTFAGLVLALSALTGATVVASSLDHLLGTPRLYGWNWDLQVSNYGVGPDLNTRRRAIAAIRGIAQFSIGGGAGLDVGRARSVGAIAVDGPVAPPVISGRRPRGPDEIALGPGTMRQAGVGIGDAVDVHVPGLRGRRLTVVGRVVTPPQSAAPQLGDGALLTEAAVRMLLGKTFAAGSVGTDVYARLRPGADPRAVAAALRPIVGRGFTVVEPQKPTDIVNFGRVQELPLILAGILAFLAGATLLHTLVTSARRRSRDLAVFKTLGFVRRQVVGVVLWQATTLAVGALLVAVPLGVALGRWAWALFADHVGVVWEPVVAGPWIAAVVFGAIAVANLISVVPARIAAAASPARALQVE